MPRHTIEHQEVWSHGGQASMGPQTRQDRLLSLHAAIHDTVLDGHMSYMTVNDDRVSSCDFSQNAGLGGRLTLGSPQLSDTDETGQGVHQPRPSDVITLYSDTQPAVFLLSINLHLTTGYLSTKIPSTFRFLCSSQSL